MYIRGDTTGLDYASYRPRITVTGLAIGGP